MANQLRWTLISALLLSAARHSTCASVDLAKIHEHMTEDELSATFNVKDRATVPNYEVVPIVHRPNQAHRNRRSVPAGHHVVTIKNLTLYLEPSDHVLLGEDTPVYLATGNKSHLHGIQYTRIDNAWTKNFNMYQDLENNAALVMFMESDGKVNVEGLIGDDMVVKPMPSRFKNSTSPQGHIIYKRQITEKTLDHELYLRMSYWGKERKAPQPAGELDTVYPELLLIVDYMTYFAHGKNVQTLCKYLAAFWNAVDLRFRSIKNPKVRLNIAGLIVETKPGGAPYMSKHIERKIYLNAEDTLIEVGKYMYSEDRFGKDTYDAVIAMTRYKLCSLQLNGTSVVCNPSTMGVSRVGGACMHSENPVDNGVTVMEDQAHYDGVLTAAHEIGHLLGVEHDLPYGGIFELCHKDFGYLMAPSSDNSPNAYLWSICSTIMMNDFINIKAKCLHNKPVIKKPIAKMLPGQLVTRKEQCSIYEDMDACEDQREDECRLLYCRKPGKRFFFLKNKCVSSGQPVEGSPCSGGGMCLDGVCIHEE